MSAPLGDQLLVDEPLSEIVHEEGMFGDLLICMETVALGTPLSTL